MNTLEPIYRYRAVNPFEEEQSMLFFGRDAEIEQLAGLIFSEKLTILYGKSGYGKSSLLHAGILPRLKKENEKRQKRYIPITVRFTIAEASSESLAQKFRFHFEQARVKNQLTPVASPAQVQLPETLWGLFKTVRTGADSPVFVLLFDQFEEFFSYPKPQQDAFKSQLSELLYTAYPRFVRENKQSLSAAELDFLSREMDVRAVFAIRSDRMSDLDSLSQPLAAILKNRMELGTLSQRQAQDAIVEPALLANDKRRFRTEPFRYQPDALRKILGDPSERIESFVLQIVCFSIEKTAERLGLDEVGVGNLPDFNELFDNYYREQLAELPENQRDTAARLLEYGLLFADAATGIAHRRSMDSLELTQTYQASPKLLALLEKTYLIRREVNSLGRFSYEISHDTLMSPILKARKERQAAEELARIEREKAAAARQRRRALLASIGAGVLILMAVAASVLAYFQFQKAEAEKQNAIEAIREANRQKQLAESAKVEAEIQKQAAEAAQLLANDNAKKVIIKAAVAEEAEKRALRNEEIANLEKKKALTESEKATLSKLYADKLLEASKIIALKKLPENFDALIPLVSLNCHDWGLKSISPEIGKLENLQSLDLSNNSLTTLPPEIVQCRSLRWLNINSNKFEGLPLEILTQMTSLKTLVIHGYPFRRGSNPFKDKDLEYIKKAMPWCKIEYWSEKERQRF